MVMSGENTDPRVEPGIGRSLEMARKSRGLSLWQVEQEIRIRSRYLHDLERENFDVLPAVYVLGSLKTYADFLGLDGAALSRHLKAGLVEPAEPDVSDQLATIGGARDEDDEYEAAPVPAVGFDQLFLGMGVILISILAVMTIVAAVAQGDESPVSQINQPSTPEAPSEIALAGNVREEDGANAAGDDGPTNDENKEAQPEAPKDDDAGEEGEDKGEKDDGDASQAASLFGDAEFVPMSPSSSPTTDASASASPTSASPAPATAEPDDAPTSTASASTAPPASTAPASTGPSQGPSEDAPDAASPAPAAPSGGASSPIPGGGGAGEPAPAGETEASNRISAEADRKVDEAFEKAGIVR
jgi:cytoskeletal protein RodZ